jgi:hypothetical protein
MIEAVADRYVYAIDDEFGKPCYIGVGKGRRMHDHVRDARRGTTKTGNSEKLKYFMGCLRRGYTPEAYKVAEDLTVHEAIEYEKTLIAWYGRRDLETGCLFNASAGGFGVRDSSPRTRTLISERTKAAMADPALRALISKKGRERFASKKARKAYSEKTKKQWQSEEGRAAFMAVSKSKYTPAVKARQAANTRRQFATTGNPMQGKKHTKEAINKMLKSQAKYWADPSIRAAQSERMRNQHADPKSHAKLYASRRARRKARQLKKGKR